MSAVRRTASTAPKGLTVLLVEDDDDLRAVTAEMLSDLGYAVRDVASAEAALDIPSDEFDLLVADIRLPGQSGEVLAAELRLRNRALAVVFVTSARTLPSAGKLRDGPVVLRKPYSSSLIEMALEEAMRRA